MHDDPAMDDVQVRWLGQLAWRKHKGLHAQRELHETRRLGPSNKPDLVEPLLVYQHNHLDLQTRRHLMNDVGRRLPEHHVFSLVEVLPQPAVGRAMGDTKRVVT